MELAACFTSSFYFLLQLAAFQFQCVALSVKCSDFEKKKKKKKNTICCCSREKCFLTEKGGKKDLYILRKKLRERSEDINWNTFNVASGRKKKKKRKRFFLQEQRKKEKKSDFFVYF